MEINVWTKIIAVLAERVCERDVENDQRRWVEVFQRLDAVCGFVTIELSSDIHAYVETLKFIEFDRFERM